MDLIILHEIFTEMYTSFMINYYLTQRETTKYDANIKPEPMYDAPYDIYLKWPCYVPQNVKSFWQLVGVFYYSNTQLACNNINAY